MVDAVCLQNSVDLLLRAVHVLCVDHLDNIVVTDDIDSPWVVDGSAVPIVDVGLVLVVDVVFVGLPDAALPFRLSIGRRSKVA